MRILLIEDHPDIAATIGDHLERHGHTVDFAANGQEGLQRALSQSFDVIVLDRILPKMEGAEVCRALRQQQGIRTPVLMLTALDRVQDKIAGLDAGADDYLVKPFDLSELLARLQALHRRAQALPAQGLTVADLHFDPMTHLAQRGAQPVPLSPTLTKLLEHLMRNTQRIVPREELEYILWGDETPDQDFLRAHLHKLRDAIDRGHTLKLLHTYRGVGYRLAALN